VLLLQGVQILYRNKAIGAGLSRAYLISDGDVVRVRLHLSRHLQVKAGQYIGLWIPAVGFWSSLQSHPFTVTSWSNEEQECLELLVEPRSGWTRKLLERASADAKIVREEAELGPAGNGVDFTKLPSHFALFSGPHGRSAPVADYETVLLISSGFGICSQLPYLRLLLYGYNACKTRNRRIHVIWQPDSQRERRRKPPVIWAAANGSQTRSFPSSHR
jgi:NAD(P)H-flavin reductase